MEKETELNKKSVLRMSNMESKQLTRECIITALLYLMKDVPFEKITVTSIIERSGVSRAGFYRNFTSKEDVLEEIAKMAHDELSASIADEKYKNNPYQWYVDFFQAIVEHPDIFDLLIQAKVPHDYLFNATTLTQQSDAPQTAKEHYFAIAASNALKEIIIDWFQNGMKESPEEMAEILMELFYK